MFGSSRALVVFNNMLQIPWTNVPRLLCLQFFRFQCDLISDKRTSVHQVNENIHLHNRFRTDYWLKRLIDPRRRNSDLQTVWVSDSRLHCLGVCIICNVGWIWGHCSHSIVCKLINLWSVPTGVSRWPLFFESAFIK